MSRKTSPTMATLVACLLIAAPLSAQRAAAFGATTGRMDTAIGGDTSVFAPIPLPPPNVYRSASGAPGPEYWQNRADYRISAALDTTTKTLRGLLTMTYTNNSPHTLDFLWMQVEQNAFRRESLNAQVFAEESRFGARGFDGGDEITSIAQLPVGGRTAGKVPLKTRTNGTMMKVDLMEALPPGGRAVVEIEWNFEIPEHGADRMGHDGALYEMAQWYPRVAVYDDLSGWNIEPYLGQGEFYLEYGDYEYEITLPSGYIVAGTGMLQNPSEVLTPAQVSRLARAAGSATPIAIVTEAELRDGTARPRSTGTLTWRFAAENVRDVAWAASPQYRWDASSWEGILAMAYYRPSAAANWEDAADQSRMAIEEYSNRWFRYPYPQISAVEGPVSGMEYPMLAMESRSRDQEDLFNVVTHEIGHNWFPMIVGSNERLYMWQDEGFNTFINLFSEARRYPGSGDLEERAAADRDLIEQYMVRGYDRTVDVPPDRIEPRLLGGTAYVKPAVGLYILREEILGAEAFDDAFRTYIERWAFKHPTPADFYRTMEDVGGTRLDWFWRAWFVGGMHFDQAVDAVNVEMEGDTTLVTVVYGNRARGVLPIRARFTMSDGSVEDFDYPAEVWSMDPATYVRHYGFVGRRPTAIALDPDHRLVDVDRANNRWSASAP